MTRFNTFLLLVVLVVCGLLVWQTSRMRHDLQQTVDAQQQLFEDILKSNDLLEPSGKTTASNNDASQLTDVKILVQSEAGRPLSGYEIELASVASVSQKVQSTDQTDDRGIAFERKLPYGEYWLRMTEPSGWRCREKVLLEFGKPFERIVIAPDPEQRGEIRFTSELRAEPLAGLRVGEVWERVSRNGYAADYSPEPDAKLGAFASLPAMGEDLRTVGCRIRMSLSANLAQPFGETYEWDWSLPVDGILATSEGSLYRIEKRTVQTVDKDEQPQFDSLEENEKLNFLALQLSEAESELVVPAAAGELTIELDAIVARTTPKWTNLLAEQADEPGPYWLEANLDHDSAWIDQFLDLSGWSVGEKFGRIANKAVTVEPSESVQISLTPPTTP